MNWLFGTLSRSCSPTPHASTAGRSSPRLSAKAGGHTVRPDGIVRDANSIPRGYWEAKDSRDDLAREIQRKIGRGYPTTNTIFEDTKRAVLFQNREQALKRTSPTRASSPACFTASTPTPNPRS